MLPLAGSFAAVLSSPADQSGTLRILHVGDDGPMRNAITEALRDAGYAVESAGSEFEALNQLKSWSPEVILLDLGVQSDSGLAIFQAIHDKSSVPIVLISPREGAADRVLLGLELGAADYLTRPLTLPAIMEKLGRVTGVPVAARTSATDAEILVCGPVTINRAQRTVFVRDREVFFRRREYDLLLALVLYARSVRSREELLTEIWGHLSVDTKTLVQHVFRLREKIELDRAHPQHIISVRGVGYYFDPGPPTVHTKSRSR
jgi:two-component system response regulator RegX3